MPATSLDSVQLYSSYIKALRESEGEKDIYINEENGKKRQEAIEEMVDRLNTEELSQEERQEALESLWLHVCFYIVKELKRYKLPKHLFEDALQNSFIKLAQKAHKYDPYFNPEYKTSFVGFLFRCRTISNAIQEAAVSNQVVKDARATKRTLLTEFINNTKDDDDEENINTNEYNSDINSITTMNYDDYVQVDPSKEGNERSSSERDVYNRELQDVFSEIFTGNFLLDQYERIALLAKYGILGHQKMTLKELEDYFHSKNKCISKARISQIQKEALEKVKSYLAKKKGLDEELVM